MGPSWPLVVFEEFMAPPSATQCLADNRCRSRASVVVHLEQREPATQGAGAGDGREHPKVSTEDLKASNEELQAINEELRSATEELETSKEELQSTNEELITVNHELKTKVEETSRDQRRPAEPDRHHRHRHHLRRPRAAQIKRFTPRAAMLFNLIATDIGRSLLDITHKLDYRGCWATTRQRAFAVAAPGGARWCAQARTAATSWRACCPTARPRTRSSARC
jgi:hypothetical protein